MYSIFHVYGIVWFVNCVLNNGGGRMVFLEETEGGVSCH